MRKVMLSATSYLEGFRGRGGDMTWMVDEEEMDRWSKIYPSGVVGSATRPRRRPRPSSVAAKPAATEPRET